eukprot:XP_023155935.1 uncharacterized protein LOC111589330 [Zea mays]
MPSSSSGPPSSDVRPIPYLDECDAPRRKRRHSASAIYTPPNITATQARATRRHLLNQSRITRKGLTAKTLTNFHTGQFTTEYVEALKASYPNRSYYGTPDYECSYCHAVFWYAERVRSNQQDSSIRYNNCCKGGKISIPPFKPRPKPLASLARFDGDATSRKFIRNIRQYNCLFAFTSMGAQIDNSVNDGRGPPLFKICGQVHHRIGTLLPDDGCPPRFIQLYIYDTTNEVQNRINALDSGDRTQDNFDSVHVSRKWSFHGATENGPLQHIDMVLSDCKV